jgi:hypothetical protein
MKKQLFASALALLMLISGAMTVFADGMIIVRPDPYSDRWDYSDEVDQQAYINYQNGLQKMIVGVKTNIATDADAIWLFPVPADPAKVVIDIATDLPQMNGEEVSGKAKASLSEAKALLYKSQLYPLLFWQEDYYGSYNKSDGVMMNASLGESVPSVMQDVVVYETLDKEGMTTEIITAKTANGLYDYFKLKGLKIEEGMIPVLDSYIGKNFSFVASWINKRTVQNTISPVTFTGSSPLCDDERIVSDLREWLLSPTMQDFFVSLTAKYPQVAALRTPDGSVSMNLDATEAYLRSANGKKALNEIVSEVKNNPVLGNKCLVVENQISEMLYSRGINYPRETVKGVSVMFPTDKIYFPLLPTSVYESKIVPVTIKVVGHVTPQLFEGIKNFSEVNYYTNAVFNGGEGNNDFFGSNNATGYTKIEINPPSKYLTNDLWIENKTPAKVAYASSVGNHPLAVSVVLLVFCSILTGLLAGLILLKDLRQSIGKLLLLGLSNCVSIIGLIVAIFYATAKQDQGEEAALMDKLKQKGYIWKRKTAQILYYAAALSMIFITFAIARSGMYINSVSLIFVYLPAILALFGWRAARISYEDMPLFSELEKKGYSTWTMRQKGPSRKMFIVFYSLLFLAISWLVVKLLLMTV